MIHRLRRHHSHRPGRRRTDQRGFTLLELLVVLVILGLVVGFAAPQVFNYLSRARTDAARVQLESLAGVLDFYRLDVGSYPSEAEGLAALLAAPPDASGWSGPYLQRREQLLDPWSRPFHYRMPGAHGAYDLFSLGADGREGGSGENRDVTNW